MNRVLDNTQKMLDRLKWEESEKQGVDMSGIMVICDYCDKCSTNTCLATQEEREKYYYCAKAYKRRNMKLKEKKWLTK